MNTNDAQNKQVELIIEQLEKGVAPWTKPWQSLGAQRNAKTGHHYNGGNALYLAAVSQTSGYNTPLWVTAKQACDLGGHVKGKKILNGKVVQEDEYDNSWIVVWFQPVEKKDKKGNVILNSKGKPELFFKHGAHSVYNVEQTTIPKEAYEHLLPKELPEPARNKAIDAFLRDAQSSCGFSLTHGGDEAAYSPLTDTVRLPKLSSFHSSKGYYSTSFHEFGHATGHTSRLNRGLLNTFRTKAYAAEELVAELTAAFLGAKYQIDGQCQHSSYIQSWLKALQNDRTYIWTAAARAKKAVTYLQEAAEKASASSQ